MKPPPLPPRCNRKDKMGFQLPNNNPPAVPLRPKKSSPDNQSTESMMDGGGATALPEEPLYENGSALSSPTTNLIILNTPSPTPKNDLLTVPNVEKRIHLKTPTSDPVSPNVPWHPELDRRHSDSANMMFAQHQQGDDHQKHTYQNTSLQQSMGTKPKVSSHDQLLQAETSNKSRQ